MSLAATTRMSAASLLLESLLAARALGLGVMLGSGGANVRNEADAGSDLIDSLNEGTILTVLDGPSYDSEGNAYYLGSTGSLAQ